MKRLILRLSAVYFLLTHNLIAQSFYNFDNFLADSAFVNRHNIKTITIKIPALLNDTANKDFVPFQKLRFNPFGKLAWYEFDYTDSNKIVKDYMHHYYRDEDAKCYMSRRFRGGLGGGDSLREEIIYHYDERGKLYFEEHHQIYISEFNEYAIGYEWFGDSLRVQYAEESRIDTAKFDRQGRLKEFTDKGWRYKVEYDAQGRRSRMSYFFMNDEAVKGVEIGEYRYFYDELDGKLQHIETLGRDVVFEYDWQGVPISSQVKDKISGKPIGLRVEYEYEFRW
jgi:YD repeat-containing protein